MIRLDGVLLNNLAKIVLDVFSAEEKHGAGHSDAKLAHVLDGASKRFERTGFIHEAPGDGPGDFIDIVIALINAIVALLNYLGVFNRSERQREPD